MNKIIFVDESQADIDLFFSYIYSKKSKDEIELVKVLPFETLKETIEYILSLKPDAIVTDYNLNELKELIKYNVPYNGLDLVKKILEIREDFPCFVLTSFDDDAVKDSDDVNMVYVKAVLADKSEANYTKITFLGRIEKQIEHYKSKIKNSENKLLELLKKRQTVDLDAYESQELIDLDSFLERALDRESQIPEIIKNEKEVKELSELIQLVDNLNEKIKSGPKK
ncbi:MAG: hypothetical protein JSS63_09920 [Bacteroidetes bacterium]|nr:hypothetical protein [Bacteroidota bacterium]